MAKLYTFVATADPVLPGAFPPDMLRYDQCWPVGSGVAALAAAIRGDRSVSVELASHSAPTHQRWASFGWQVRVQRIG